MSRGTKSGFGRKILLRRMESLGLDSSSDPDAVVHHLRSQYPDYARHKIKPFSHFVHTHLLQLQRSQTLAKEDPPSPETRKVKRKKRRPHPDEEGSSLLDEDAVYEAPVEPQFDITRSMLRAHYERKSLGKQQKDLVLEEENAPAPQPVSQRLLGSAAAEEINREERKVNETPGAVWSGAGRDYDLGEVEDDDGPRFRDFGGIDSLINGLVRTVLIPLCHPEVPQTLGVRPVAGVLLHGPPGCGKTRLAHAIGNETRLPFYSISAAEVVSGVSGESEGNIRQLFRKAYRTAPSIVFIDEIDAIASKRENMHKEMERRIVTQLMTCMDESQQMASSVDAGSDSEASYKKPGYVLVIGATNRPDVLDPALRRPGRFDKEIGLGVPDENTRKEILKVLTRKVRVEGSLDFLKLARSTPGFVGADLTALVNEAGNRAMERVIDKKEAQFNIVKERDKCDDRWWKRPWEINEIQNLCITMSDFEEATKLVQPSLKREGFSSIPDVKWEDVGGLLSLRKELERIVRYIRNPDIYKEVGVTSGKGFLLYGPPGCGKTLVAKALAHEAGANFIHVKGPELLSKYVGESELAVRTLFSRARTCSPCIIFFDEIDALTTKRGEEGGQVVERLVTQLLTELNGIDERHGVHVFGATNRIEAVDRAILRHGRLGNLIYVPIPGTEERIQILRALFRKKPLDADVDLDATGRSEACENLSGADLAEVVEEAAMLAVEERTEAMEMTTVPLTCVIKSSHIEQALAKISPSVLVEERNHYEILAREYMKT